MSSEERAGGTKPPGAKAARLRHRAARARHRIARAWLFALVAALWLSLAGSAFAFLSPANLYRSGLPGTKTIALTFDDGPSGFTAALLAYLKDENIKASFFVVGEHARTAPKLLLAMSAAGDVIGNHSETHRPLSASLAAKHPDAVDAEIADTDKVIAPYLGPDRRRYFRAPYATWSPAAASLVNADPRLGDYIGPVFWDVGGEVQTAKDGTPTAAADWQCWADHWSVAKCADAYLDEIHRKRGGIVILHDTHAETVALIERIVPQLLAEGYRFITLDDVHAFDKYAPDNSAIAVAARGDYRQKPMDLLLTAPAALGAQGETDLRLEFGRILIVGQARAPASDANAEAAAPVAAAPGLIILHRPG